MNSRLPALATATLLVSLGHAQLTSLRFYGTGTNDIDRVKISVDRQQGPTVPGPPADVGATDFTIEFWLKARDADNNARTVSCGTNFAWINGNVVLDRDRWGPTRDFGIAINGNGRLMFGVETSGARTICGTTSVLDDQWHHVAVMRRRSDGRLWIYVDGVMQATADGPDGDLSYPDGATGSAQDPFLVIAAEKHDVGPSYPSFNGHLCELRLSTTLRYSSNFTRPTGPFTTDSATAALYHFDAEDGETIVDSSGATGGPSHGLRRYGGAAIKGPVFTTESPFRTTCATMTMTHAPRTGNLQNIALSAPCSANRGYIVGWAFTSSPGFRLGAHHVPLNPDALFFNFTSIGAVFAGYTGTLDSLGRGTAGIAAPAILQGFPVHAALITLDPNGQFGIGAISGAMRMRSIKA